MKRVLIIGDNKFDSVEFHLTDTMSDMGIESKILTFREIMKVPKRTDMVLRRVSKKYDNFTLSKMRKKIVDYRPDLIIVTYRHVNPALIGELKRQLDKTTIIHINVDALSNLRNQQVLASPYDYFFSKDPFMVQFMKEKAGLNTYYLPEAHNPNVHKRPDVAKNIIEQKVDIDVLMFGNMYPYRWRIVEHLISKGIQVKLFGKKGSYFPEALSPHFQNLYITGDEKVEFLYGAKIVLNNFHYAEIEGANCKYFEINGIGAFQICDYKDSLKEYSSVDPERYTYRTIEDAVVKINHFLKNPNERYQIANEHYEYATAHNTYRKRIETIFQTIGFQY